MSILRSSLVAFVSLIGAITVTTASTHQVRASVPWDPCADAGLAPGSACWGYCTAFQAIGCPGQTAYSNACQNQLDRFTDLACGEMPGTTPTCPCFDSAMLQATDGPGSYLQQRFEWSDGDEGLNWVGDAGHGFVEWNAAGTSRCEYSDGSTTQSQPISYEAALVCDDLLNEFALSVGAVCSSEYCP